MDRTQLDCSVPVTMEDSRGQRAGNGRRFAPSVSRPAFCAQRFVSGAALRPAFCARRSVRAFFRKALAKALTRSLDVPATGGGIDQPVLLFEASPQV
jgi:hypothetical protein